MNNKTKIALAAVPLALALAYPASAWIVGKRVEAAIAGNYRLLDENPSLKIVERDYQRGLFSATETLTIELLGNVTQAMARQQQEVMAANPGLKLPPVQPIRVTIRSRIKHGPLPALNKLAAAVVDSELLLQGELQKQVEGILGDGKPLQVHSEYRFDGGGVSTLSSPAFSTHWQAAEGAGQNTLAWGGLTMNVDFEPGMRRYSIRAEAPRLEMKQSRGGQLTFAEMRLEGTQQRLFDDDPLLYSGVQKLTVARFSAGSGEEGSEPVEARRIAYEAEIPVNGDFIDLIGRLGSESLRVGGKDYGPVHYDFSLRHVHARTAAALYREMLRVSSDVELQAAAQAEPATMFAPLAKPALALLQHGPEISIDRLSFRSPHGDAALAARMKLANVDAGDFSTPLLLLAKLDASAEISVPEALLGELAVAGTGAPAPATSGMPQAEGIVVGEAPDPAESAAARAETMRQRVADLAAQGFVVREGGLLRTKLAFSKGRMTVNGRPFNPQAIGGPAGGM
ncbi:MAG: YdgA family protein [Rhodocyclales bacterium]|nr:YdgA family protein [Rhodocyclales bacterium]